MKKDVYIIDATDISIGRIATKAVAILRGKDKREFMPNVDGKNFVLVKNLSRAKFTGKKFIQKKHYSYSGYPGGIKEMPLSKTWARNPHEALKKAIWGMLPKNKLRQEQIKRLKSEL